MRLAMYLPARRRAKNWRIGAAVDGFMLDLEAAAVAYAHEHPAEHPGFMVPATILDLLRCGEDVLVHIRRVHAWGCLIAPHDNDAGLFELTT